MKLSEQIAHDFKSGMTGPYYDTRKSRIYEMSYGYLMDLLEKAVKLENELEEVRKRRDYLVKKVVDLQLVKED